jgi:C_GCAxxG_C_C family probable redox protein
MSIAENAVKTFGKGFNCSQGVLSAFSDELGMDAALAYRVASAFGGGMARMGGTCGAVTGAFMVLGLKYGMTAENALKSNDKVYARVKEFVEEFKARHGSITCRDLLGFDISDRETLLEVRKKGLFQTLCPEFVKSAAEIVETLI